MDLGLVVLVALNLGVVAVTLAPRLRPDSPRFAGKAIGARDRCPTRFVKVNLILRATAVAIVALVVASCGPRPEDTMLYLCDGALEIQAATASARDALNSQVSADPVTADRYVDDAKASLARASDSLATARSIAPSDYSDWVGGMASAVEAVSRATALLDSGGSPGEIGVFLDAADDGRAAMGPASDCQADSPGP